MSKFSRHSSEILSRQCLNLSPGLPVLIFNVGSTSSHSTNFPTTDALKVAVWIRHDAQRFASQKLIAARPTCTADVCCRNRLHAFVKEMTSKPRSRDRFSTKSEPSPVLAFIFKRFNLP